jgi:putative ABC transport system permease protein
MLSSTWQDVRFALRMLRRSPGFTAVAVATMALAIGANTAIFSIVHGVLLKPLPFADPGRLVLLGHHTDGGDLLDSTTPGNFYDWQRGAPAFQSMAAFSYTTCNLTGRDGALGAAGAERVRGVASAGSIFDVLGRKALLGRTFGAAEDGPGAARVVVLSYGLWRRLFGANRRVVDRGGRVLTLDGEPYTILGVMPPDFAFPDGDAELWLPARFDAAFRDNRDQYFLLAVARLAPGVALAQAQAQLDAVTDRIRLAHPQETQNVTAGVQPLKDALVEGVRPRLLTLMGAVLFILLISCANLGNLLLARAAERRREMALRHALGARPVRLMRQTLTESALLALAGGAAGLLAGAALLDALVSWLAADLPRAHEIRLDPTVLAFTLAVSLLSGLAFGLFPALQPAGRGPAEALRDGARGSGRGGAVRAGLVIAEVALALVLLAGAGLLARSFVKLLAVDPGFRTDRLLTFRLGVAAGRERADHTLFFAQVRERLQTLPGVRAVTMASSLPVTRRGNGAWFNVLAKPLPPGQTPPGVAYRVVAPDYLQVMGIPLLRGRHLTPQDRLDGVRGVVISESVARRFWPHEEALGERIYLGAPDNRLFPDGVVVGIAADVKQAGLDDEAAETVYVPSALMPPWPDFSFALRTSLAPESLAAAARARLRELDPTVPMFEVKTMDEVIAASVAPARSSMLLVGLFALLALLLAAIGVFGVLSYTVAQRTRELGIRLALGATARGVSLLVLGQGMLQVLAGVVLGLAGAWALTRFMASLLYGVAPDDPLTFAAVALALAAIAALASYLPARRATRVDPMEVLRQE